ncbi:hypothetical protein RhiXN_11448 [Rhizoctonia solani]|uniref:Uncharacterized protein n=1 Tax=Rhizoctonia solani TaxID=456999 RepID=A0A8H8SZP9_9AGAM|nr:uncharacterized protein RhiXN_11448 [Rhizoctonia solani]QRW24536.1 hypothetical protein RhiXN_11448 [Rhizoctonia solani]
MVAPTRWAYRSCLVIEDGTVPSAIIVGAGGFIRLWQAPRWGSDDRVFLPFIGAPLRIYFWERVTMSKTILFFSYGSTDLVFGT